jgi:hypothetical protein
MFEILIGRRRTMSHTKNNHSTIKTTASKRGRTRGILRGIEITLVVLVAVLLSSMLSGCGASSELFVLTHPVLPTGLNATEIEQYRAREVERRQFERLGQDSSVRMDRDGTAGPGIPLLTWRFGGGSSRSDLAKRYALHKDSLWDSNTSNVDVAQGLSRNER